MSLFPAYENRPYKLSVAKKSTQTFFSQLLVFVQGILLTPVIIKVSGPEEFGKYTLLISYLGLMFGVSTFGVGISAKRFIPGALSKDKINKLFYPQFWFQSCTVLLLAVFTIVVFSLDKIQEHIEYDYLPFFIIFYMFFHFIYTQASLYYRYTSQIGAFNFLTVIHPYLYVSISIMIYLIYDILTVQTLLFSVTAAYFFVGVIGYYYVTREIGIDFRWLGNKSLWKEIKLGAPLIFAYLVDFILAFSDRYIIAMMVSVKAVGMYVPAYALGSIVIIVPKVLGIVIAPEMSKRKDLGDDDGVRRLSKTATNVFLMISVPYCCGCMYFGEEILELYANREVAENTWKVMPIISLAIIFYGIVLIRSNLLFVMLKTKALLYVNLVSALVNVVLNVYLLSVTGNVVYAAVATFISYVISYILMSYRLKTNLNDGVDIKYLMSLVVASSIMVGLMHLIYSYISMSGVIAIIVSIFSGVIVYMIGLLLQPITLNELKKIKSLLVK